MTGSADVMRPLATLKVVEFEGLGPGPLAGWMLVGLGAQVTLVRRPGGNPMADQLGGPHGTRLVDGKRHVTLDLKRAEGLAAARELIATHDALIEGNRPGVMERLGLGPADVAALNPKLVYGRMTGWGQTGPLAQAAGHDLNYVALSGMLSLGARRDGEPPIVPPTVLGDAGGALGLALGIVSGVLAARQPDGWGCVVDAAIVDVVAMLGTLALWIHGGGQLAGPRADSPFHDSPFYEVYRCADGGCISLAALEPAFWAIALQRLGLDDIAPDGQYDVRTWPALKARLTTLFASQPRSHWDARLEGSDACYAPVLGLAEAAAHPHNAARGTLRVDPVTGQIHAAMAPRFSALDQDR
ncbi:CaiB/BaiF CoA transferase family protein [Leptothrix sp. BB-4]